jgi:hypothetical protein
VLALCDARDGRAEDAERALSVVDALPRDGMWLGSTAIAAEACCEAAATGAAERLLEAMRPHAGEWCAFAWGATWGPADLWLGRLSALLGREDDALGHLVAAEEQAHAVHARGWALHARHARARLEGEPLDAIATEAEELGLARLAATARRVSA